MAGESKTSPGAFNPLKSKLDAIARQQAIADALIQNRQPLQARQVGAGRVQYVQAPSAFEAIANVAQTGLGAYLGNKSNQQYDEVAKAMGEQRNAAAAKIAQSETLDPVESQAYLDAGGDGTILKLLQEAREKAADRKAKAEALPWNVRRNEAGEPEYRPGYLEGEERLRRAAIKPDQPAAARLVSRPAGNGNLQDYAFDPREHTYTAIGDPYPDTQAQPGGSKGPSQPSEGERKNAALATRLQGASDVINAADPADRTPGFAEKVLSPVSETAANFFRTPGRQSVNAAQRDAKDALLTLSTGAAYTGNQEKAIDTSYLPQLGDDPATVASKEQRFKAALESSKQASGRSRPAIDAAIDAAKPPSGNTAPPAQLPLRNANGWTLHTDASGNQAYVGPNGEIEEVP